jgi:hypothetical protein
MWIFAANVARLNFVSRRQCKAYLCKRVSDVHREGSRVFVMFDDGTSERYSTTTKLWRSEER